MKIRFPTAAAKRIKLVLMDVDGVLTDGRLCYIEASPGRIVETKAFHSHDGIGIVLLRKAGLRLGWISGRASKSVAHRAKLLGVEFVHLGVNDKRPVFDRILKKTGLSAPEAAYIGDDVPDVALMRRVGLPAAPSDARPEALHAARYVTRRPGGQGAVRELAEGILKARGLWHSTLAKEGA